MVGQACVAIILNRIRFSGFSPLAPASSGVRVTYLGTNGYFLETSESTILIDLYFHGSPGARGIKQLHQRISLASTQGWIACPNK